MKQFILGYFKFLVTPYRVPNLRQDKWTAFAYLLAAAFVINNAIRILLGLAGVIPATVGNYVGWTGFIFFDLFLIYLYTLYLGAKETDEDDDDLAGDH